MPRNDEKHVFCDSDVLKNVLKFQIFSDLKIKISCAQACLNIGARSSAEKQK